MKRLLIALHVSLIATVLTPVFGPDWLGTYATLEFSWTAFSDHTPWDSFPLVQGIKLATGRFWLRSIAAAGLPGFLALLNLPPLLHAGDRWRALSSLVLGLLSASTMVQLLARYGEGREWGGWAIWILSLLLTISGLVACVRLSPSDSQFAIRDSKPRPR